MGLSTVDDVLSSLEAGYLKPVKPCQSINATTLKYLTAPGVIRKRLTALHGVAECPLCLADWYQESNFSKCQDMDDRGTWPGATTEIRHTAMGSLNQANHFHFVRILSLLNVALLSMYIRITATSKPAEIMSRFVLLDSDTMPISPRIYSA